MEIWMIIIALAIAILPNIGEKGLTGFILSRMGLDSSKLPDGIPQEIWDAVQPVSADVGGKWIGSIERFVSSIAAWLVVYEILAGWFAFKVASKWETWSNVVKVPDSLDGKTDITYLKARRILSSHLYARFLLGSGINVCVGIVIGVFGKFACNKICS
jgi:hypothetical protein